MAGKKLANPKITYQECRSQKKKRAQKGRKKKGRLAPKRGRRTGTQKVTGRGEEKVPVVKSNEKEREKSKPESGRAESDQGPRKSSGGGSPWSKKGGKRSPP